MNHQLNKQSWPTIFIHIVIWGLLFLLPFIIIDFDLSEFSPPIAHFFVLLIFSVILFYINYFFTVPKFLFKKRYLTFLLISILYIGPVIVVSTLVKRSFDGPPGMHQEMNKAPHRKGSPPPLGNNKHMPPERSIPLIELGLEILSLILVIGVSTAVKVTTAWHIEEGMKRELEKEQISTELAFLKNQVNPHFFFNTLNNIYALMEEDVSQAQKATHKLSKLMRYLLYESESKTVLLKDEISFLNNFIDLMKIRLTDKVKLNVSLESEFNNIKVPPLLFIPFIENAFKHGVSYKHHSYIDISLYLQDDHLNLEVENSNHQNHIERPSGIGLQNIRKRLELLYKGNYSLSIAESESKYFISMSIPILVN